VVLASWPVHPSPSGDIVTMPGLQKEPTAYRIDLSDDGEVVGL
jgi:formate--tetrahydrofolate ligase